MGSHGVPVESTAYVTVLRLYMWGFLVNTLQPMRELILDLQGGEMK